MPKRVMQGTVVSDKNDKTVVVKIERRFTHPVMKKTVRMSKKYHAHDESNACKVGDIVLIQEAAPMSKNKRWVVVTEAQAE
ncbi:MAG: 30S ribosomal protein S17 [Aliihoeflea sp.]|jgi:small subunit ribosomal protein S17